MHDVRVTPYIGKGDYCYANSAAMLLAATGESIDPGVIESLTGMGIGAFLIPAEHLLFFDSSDPDRGISRALRALGFTFDERARPDPDEDPMPDLARVLERGPAVLGPLELGRLPYNPRLRGTRGSGADHYVLAHGMTDTYVYLHDPWGFPYARIAHDDLRAAWRADAIAYRRGHYRLWTNARRLDHPPPAELYRRAIATYQEVVRVDAPTFAKNGLATGPDAIRQFARFVSGARVPPDVKSFLTSFCLPLATRRAIDIANFLAPHNPFLADLKANEAAVLGTALCQVVDDDDEGAASSLREVANAEEAFIEEVVRIPV